MARKVNVKTVKPENDEKVVKKVKKASRKKDKKILDEKKEKVYRILDEIKAFLVIDLIVFTVAFAGWYWYTHFYSEERNFSNETSNNEVVDYKSLKYISEDGHTLDVLNKKYLIEYDNKIVYKIMDLKANVLYEGDFKYTNIYEGIDGNLYITRVEDAGYSNLINLYVLKNNELEEIKELSESKAYFSPIKYYDEITNEFKLVGFTAFKSMYDEDMKETNKSYIYSLIDDEVKELDDYQLFGDSINLKEDNEEVITYDERYIVINNLKENDKKYGLYDIENNKVIVTPQYDGMFTNKDDEYIVIRNGKYGIVNKSLKKIIDFEYDFIDRNNGFYVVCKNDKLAIMNEQYELVSEYDFDYQKLSENEEYNYLNDFKTFVAYKISDKYVLTVNFKEYSDSLNYDKHETYVINSDESYKTIEENEFVVNLNNSLIYSFDKTKKTYTFYDQDLNEMYNIDISNYDYNSRAIVSLLNESTIEIKLDSEIYYDYETGKEISGIKDYSYMNNDIEITYKNTNHEVSYQFDNKELNKIRVNKDLLNNKLHNSIEDSMFYYLTNEEYILVYKGE